MGLMHVTSQSYGNRATPALPLHPGFLNDSRCNSSSIEAGVLVAFTGHDPTPPERSTYYHWWRVTRPPLLLYPPGKREPAYLSGGFSSVYSRTQSYDKHNYVI
ncbi:hypothetical protein AVEN_237923-1 [Araneus ventricosus]|uniref:Uncharacterized protein n=1 Tax=Araneus ventricosus TaxID=182803 RepID=A0A4Y2FYV7_ARAVE|nr:hypothetical protein AVEN_237923-1 [Araneus ventricosus]